MGKLKVHELAKELGLESKELIKKAKEVGIEVTSHLSSLEEEQIQKIKNIFENKGVKTQKSMEQEKNKEKKETDLTQFISNVKKYTEITELTPEILNELIEKIIIHQTEKINGKKVQEIDIYYRGVGIISFPVNLDDIEVTIKKILNKKTA